MMSRRRFLLSLVFFPSAALSPPFSPAGLSSSSDPQDIHRARSFLAGTHSLLHTAILKNNLLFLVTDRDGSIRPHAEGRGLFYHDCRYLSRYELTINEQAVQPLMFATDGFEGSVYLTNGKLPEEAHSIKEETVHVAWMRWLDADTITLRDTLTVTNYGRQAAPLRLALAFDAGFEDVYGLKGAVPRELGTRLPPEVHRDSVSWDYDGKDGIRRRVAVRFDPHPDFIGIPTAEFRPTIPPHGRFRATIVVQLSEDRQRTAVAPVPAIDDAEDRRRALRDGRRAWLSSLPNIVTDHEGLNELLAQSFQDLHTLQCELDGRRFLAAGTPWFVGLFGRDSLISALQCVGYDRPLAADTLRLLAAYQGRRNEERQDEQPGKILHELRLGEAAHLHLAGQAPYYGTVDATLWFLILLARHAQWDGSLALFRELRTHVERALAWLRQADAGGEHFISYSSRKDEPLANHGWKDSGKAIVNADGSKAQQPIALVAAQGYAYLARRAMAELYWRAGDEQQAAVLTGEAQRLRARFNQRFWVPDRQFYALALQKGDVPAAAMSSNPGQALWTGIVEESKAAHVVGALMSDAMFSGWGIRTLSAEEPAYDPMSYELGSVWPFDNAFIAAAFRRYGFDREAVTICDGLVDAAGRLPARRLPELFCGFGRKDMPYPVPHPKADHPQAWSSGALPSLLLDLLGLVPDGFARRLTIVRPVLPTRTDSVELHGLTVGDARVSLRFARQALDRIHVDVLEREGDIDVVLTANSTGFR